MSPNKKLIRCGTVISMDPLIGDVVDGDILIEDGRITYVGPRLGEVDAEEIDASRQIVMPGMIDTHRHTWQIQARGICGDWTLDDYFAGIRLDISPSFRPADLRLGNYAGALDAINAGVTTLLDFSHCNNTPEHSQAAMQGLRDSGIRGVFAYGFFESNPDAPGFPDHPSRLKDFSGIADNFDTNGGLLKLGVALTEVGTVPWERTVDEIQAGRHAGALIAAHTGAHWGSQLCMGILEMQEARLLGPDMVHIHCNTLSDIEWLALASAGAKVSISPETEMNMGMGIPVFDTCKRYGIKASLSTDVVSLNSGDLFGQMRLGIAAQRVAANMPLNAQGKMPDTLSSVARDAIAWATINGADACGLENEVGTLSVGKRADVVILGSESSFNLRPVVEPTASVVFQANAGDVDTVLIDGEIRKRHGRLVGVDTAQLLTELEASSRAILGRTKTLQGVGAPYRPETSTAARAASAEANLNVAHAGV